MIPSLLPATDELRARRWPVCCSLEAVPGFLSGFVELDHPAGLAASSSCQTEPRLRERPIGG
jgi:hypothetical protein